MINRLSAYQNPLVQGYQRPAAAPAPAPTSTVEASTAAAAPRGARDVASAGDLSGAERAMIDQYFPAGSASSMRLYGPAHATTTMQAGAVGSRLDLRG